MKRIVAAALIAGAATVAVAPPAVASESTCQVCEKLLAPVRELFRPCGPLIKCP